MGVRLFSNVGLHPIRRHYCDLFCLFHECPKSCVINLLVALMHLEITAFLFFLLVKRLRVQRVNQAPHWAGSGHTRQSSGESWALCLIHCQSLGSVLFDSESAPLRRHASCCMSLLLR